MPSKTLSIIVNADDLGISREVNEAIFDRMDRGTVTSATLLANAPYVEEAARQLRRFPQCSFGAHLNLTQFAPLSAAGRRLVDPETGALSRRIAGRRYSRELAHDVAEEFAAQIQRLLALGAPLSHLDSHHHIHTRPFVFPALKAVQRRFGLARVRLSKNLYAAPDVAGAKLRVMKWCFNSALRYYSYRTRTTEAFTEFRTFSELLRQGRPMPKSVELMVHPGAESYAQETALLDGEWILESTQYHLISYTHI